MSDKPLAGLVALAAILPLCAICVLGPAAAGALLASVVSWLGGLSPAAIAVAAAGGAALGYGLWRRRGRSQVQANRSM